MASVQSPEPTKGWMWWLLSVIPGLLLWDERCRQESCPQIHRSSSLEYEKTRERHWLPNKVEGGTDFSVLVSDLHMMMWHICMHTHMHIK